MVVGRPPVQLRSLALLSIYSLRRCVRCAMLPHRPQPLHLCVKTETETARMERMEKGKYNRYVSPRLSLSLALYPFVYCI